LHLEFVGGHAFKVVEFEPVTRGGGGPSGFSDLSVSHVIAVAVAGPAKFGTAADGFCAQVERHGAGLHSGEDFRKSTWSVTGLESFINCPFKYYLTKLIPLDKNDYSKRFIGTAIHKVFEKFNHVDYVFEDALKEALEGAEKNTDAKKGTNSFSNAKNGE
jgi:hypothetical protein